MTARSAVSRAVDASLVELHRGIARYYTSKISKYGATPLGVDWSCAPTQELRFLQLLKFDDVPGAFSLNDLGCGYGALVAFLAKRYPRAAIDYLGIDLSQAMIRHAARLWRDKHNVHFVVGSRSPRFADYSVASGIFNVNPGFARNDWECLVASALTEMCRSSRRGFAANFLAQRGTASEPKALYRSSPATWIHYCKEELGCDVELLDGYGLREFTILAMPRSHGNSTSLLYQ
ncbi:MAG TPA: class I SAM-dependent methyltransferase [Casimicrobiaceae bacterium]|nr:class I SAM-dependent methyltransferase [Casimicrobiaceae bacterium]